MADSNSIYVRLLIDNGVDTEGDRRSPSIQVPTLGSSAIALKAVGADAWEPGEENFRTRWQAV